MAIKVFTNHEGKGYQLVYRRFVFEGDVCEQWYFSLLHDATIPMSKSFDSEEEALQYAERVGLKRIV